MYFPVYYALDIAASGFLAMAAASRGRSGGMPFTGAVALGCLAGLSSPLLRDVLLGFGAPAPLHDGGYAACALAGALAGWCLAAWRGLDAFFWSDAVSLGLASAMGASRAAVLGLGPVGCLVLGMCAGSMGGVVRDVCLGDTPYTLTAEFHVTAGAMGCMLATGLAHMFFPGTVQVLAGGLFVVVLRVWGRRSAAAKGYVD